MKTYPGRNTYTQFQKRSLPVSVHLSESDLLFQCIPLLKYIKVLSNHILTTVLLFGMALYMSFDLRDASQKLYLPKLRTDYLKRSFSYSGASLWNDLPEDIHTTKSLRNFKRRIEKWLSVSDSHTANM